MCTATKKNNLLSFLSVQMISRKKMERKESDRQKKLRKFIAFCTDGIGTVSQQWMLHMPWNFYCSIAFDNICYVFGMHRFQNVLWKLLSFKTYTRFEFSNWYCICFVVCSHWFLSSFTVSTAETVRTIKTHIKWHKLSVSQKAINFSSLSFIWFTIYL